MQNLNGQADALALWMWGLDLFPLRPRSYEPVASVHPRWATHEPWRIIETWDDQPDANIGLWCGSGRVVLEVTGEEAHARVRELGMPRTVTARSGRGWQFFLTGNWNGRSRVFPGAHLVGEGEFVVAPGSIGPDETAHEWFLDPSEAPFALAPAWLFEAAARPASGRTPRLWRRGACGGSLERGTRSVPPPAPRRR